jgi:hypothetical protein
MQSALNDIPTLSPDLVTVTQSLANDGFSILYTVKFSPDLGNVSAIHEVLGLVNFTLNVMVNGSPTGKRIQLEIGNSITPLFDLSNKSSV